MVVRKAEPFPRSDDVCERCGATRAAVRAAKYRYGLSGHCDGSFPPLASVRSRGRKWRHTWKPPQTLPD